MKKKGGPADMTPDDRRIWSRVSASVTPPKTRKAERIAVAGPQRIEGSAEAEILSVAATRPGLKTSTPRSPSRRAVTSPAIPPTPRLHGRSPPEALEPRRQRRLSRERDPIDGRLDLHGFGRFEAEDQLRAFLMGAQARGWGAVLVITGQGRRGGTGVIRGSVHEWLAAPALRTVVSGFAAAARKHGGDGAIYVTIRRR